MNENQILSLAIRLFGQQKQRIVAIEEMSELQKALCKFERKQTNENINSIAEEIADVEIMIKQLKIMFGIDDQVEEIKDYKIKRLENRVKGAIKL
jgi:NTP pyrophosphatase (non-canonical NTP hydrolase)